MARAVCLSRSRVDFFIRYPFIRYIMSISITIDDIVPFKVKGTIKDAKGVDKPFVFGLTCERMAEEDITDRMKGHEGSISAFASDFMGDVIRDWSDVLDDEKKAVPYSLDGWQQLCRNVPGLSMVALNAYRTESSAKAKN